MNPNTNYAALIQGIIGQNQAQSRSREQLQFSENQLLENMRQFDVAEKGVQDRFDETFDQTEEFNAPIIAGRNEGNKQLKFDNENQRSLTGLANYGDNWQRMENGGFSWNDLDYMLTNDQAAVAGSIEAVQKADPRFQKMMENMGVDGKVTGAGKNADGGYYVTAVQPNGKIAQVPVESGAMQYMTTYVQQTLDREGRGASASNTMLEKAKYADGIARQAAGQANRVNAQVQTERQPTLDEEFRNRQPAVEKTEVVQKRDPNRMVTGYETLTREGANYGVKGQSAQGAQNKSAEELANPKNEDVNLEKRIALKKERQALQQSGGDPEKIASLTEQIKELGINTKEIVTSKTAPASTKLKAIKENPTEAMKSLSQDPDARVPGKRTKPPASKFSSEEQSQADREFDAAQTESQNKIVKNSMLQDRVWLAVNQMANNRLTIKEANNFAAFGSTDISSTKTFVEQVVKGTDGATRIQLMKDLADIAKIKSATGKTNQETLKLSYENKRSLARVVTASTNFGLGQEGNEGMDEAAVDRMVASIDGSQFMLTKIGIDTNYLNEVYSSPGEIAESFKIGNDVMEQLGDGMEMFQNYNGDRILIGLVARESGIMGAKDGWFTDSNATDEIKKFYDLGEETGIEAGRLMSAFLQNRANNRLSPSASIDDFIQIARERYAK